MCLPLFKNATIDSVWRKPIDSSWYYRSQQAKGDDVWRHFVRKDFGQDVYQSIVKDDSYPSWIAAYQELASIVKWDPACADPCFSFWNDNRTVKRTGTQGWWPKVISSKPLTQRKLTLRIAFRYDFELSLCTSTSNEDVRFTLLRSPSTIF